MWGPLPFHIQSAWPIGARYPGRPSTESRVQWGHMLDIKAVVTLVKTYKYVDRLESVLSPILAPGVNLTDFLVVEGSRRCGGSHILTVY